MRVETLDFHEILSIEFVVHMSTRRIIFHRIDSHRNLYIDMKILKKITIRYIEYIQMYLYRNADTIYDDNNTHVHTRTSAMDRNK